ncbi:MAG: hypothetical protein NZM05_12470, partial [Chloroherpetonaceae bacterium]|nr:hypothetical protein [Chloroherpetonaceae bacterium]
MYLSHYFKPLPVKTKEGHRLSSLDTLSYNEEDGITMNVPFLFAQSLLSCLEQTKIYADDKILIKTYGYKPCFVEHQSNSTAVDRWSEYLLRYHISRVEFRKEGVWRFVIEPFHGEIFPNYPSVIRQCPVAKAVVSTRDMLHALDLLAEQYVLRSRALDLRVGHKKECGV